MYPRVVCFTLALILGVSAFADEKKRGQNLFANLSYTVNNSSEDKIQLRVYSAKKNGDNARYANLATVKEFEVESGREAIYYNTASEAHATFYIVVKGKRVADRPFLFNSELDNPTIGYEINPAREHLDVFVYHSDQQGWVAFWQILPNH